MSTAHAGEPFRGSGHIPTQRLVVQCLSAHSVLQRATAVNAT
jgi:hypothetical protein